MPKHIPERTCIVTREAGGPAELMRFVLGPGDEVVPDLRNKLPGRGAWVTPTAAAVGEAVRRKLFARAFKQPVAAPRAMPRPTDGASSPPHCNAGPT
jgi:predicted RNA-binding protein YlxR (DUF448 family)